MSYGLTSIELKRLTYELSAKNGKVQNFNSDKEMVDVHGIKTFLKRRKNLSICKPEATPVVKAMKFNKMALCIINQLIEYIYDKYELIIGKI